MYHLFTSVKRAQSDNHFKRKVYMYSFGYIWDDEQFLL